MNITLIDYAKNKFLSSEGGHHLAGHKAAEHAIASAWKSYSRKELTLRKKEILISKDRNGKPRGAVQSGSHLKKVAISISHAFPFALGAASADEGFSLGADVERIRNFSPAVRSAFLTPSENFVLNAKPQIERQFYATLCWSLKESVLKALGAGLRVRPSRVDVSKALLRRDGAATIRVDKIEYHSKIKWQSIDKNRYVIAVVALPKGRAV